MEEWKNCLSNTCILKDKWLKEGIQKYFKNLDVNGVFKKEEIRALSNIVKKLEYREGEERAKQLRREKNLIYLERRSLVVGDPVYHQAHRKILVVEKIDANGFLYLKGYEGAKDPFGFEKLRVRKEDAPLVHGWKIVGKSELEELGILFQAVSLPSLLRPGTRLYFIPPEVFWKARRNQKKNRNLERPRTENQTLNVSIPAT